MVKVDFSSLNNNYDLVPEGTYSAEIMKVQIKSNKNNNSKHLCWTLKITDSPEEWNCLLFIITPLAENALWRLKKLLKVLHYPISNSVVDIDTDKLAGKKLKVTVVQEKYQGKLYNKVLDFKSID
jgi:hypothetical protein